MNESSSVMKVFVSKAAAVSGKYNDRIQEQIHFFNNPEGTLKLSVKSGDFGGETGQFRHNQTGNWE
jgi:hypothetical protein